MCFLGGGSGLGDRQVGVWAATGEEVFGSDDFFGKFGEFFGCFWKGIFGGFFGSFRVVFGGVFEVGGR